MTRYLLPALLALAITTPAIAASDDECAIWLCLPVGFVPGECSKARTAMYKRVFKGKGPLPRFSSCSADGNANGFDARRGVAAKIKDTNPTEYVLGRQCVGRDHNDASVTNTTNTSPPNCVGTYNWIQIYQHGNRHGERYFWRR